MKIHSLAELRGYIDEVDREIVSLIAKRGLFVREAVKFKSSSSDVAAPNRVQQVIDKVRAMAIEKQLEPEVAEATYRAMISAFIEVEQAAFDHRSI